MGLTDLWSHFINISITDGHFSLPSDSCSDSSIPPLVSQLGCSHLWLGIHVPPRTQNDVVALGGMSGRKVTPNLDNIGDVVRR